MEKYIYTGWFLDKGILADAMDRNDLGGQHLVRIIKHPHITHQYLPEEYRGDLFGRWISVEVTGYGNDGANEGLAVRYTGTEKQIHDLWAEIPVPHITVSVAEGAKPVDTRNLVFHDIQPFSLWVCYGGWSKQDELDFAFLDENRM